MSKRCGWVSELWEGDAGTEEEGGKKDRQREGGKMRENTMKKGELSESE